MTVIEKDFQCLSTFCHSSVPLVTVLTVMDSITATISQDNWTIRCIITPSFRVIVNCRTWYSLQPEWGIRQGNPIFPIYLIIFVEYLNVIFISCPHIKSLVSASN